MPTIKAKQPVISQRDNEPGSWNKIDSLCERLSLAIRERLGERPRVGIQRRGQSIAIVGAVSSYYHRQVVQETVKVLIRAWCCDELQIEDQVVVEHWK